MNTADLLQYVDKMINQDWTNAPPTTKMDLIKVLRKCKPALGLEGIQGWVTRIAHAWRIPREDILALIKEEAPDIALLKPKALPPRVAKDIYPKTGFISDYLQYTMNSEAPKSFHFWTAISVLGAVLGRNVSMNLGHSDIYPNHFIILVAPSGRCRKTSAANIGIDLLYAMDTINVIAEKITPEALLDSMKTMYSEENPECRGFIYAPELPVFLGKQKYNEGMIDILTRFGDNPDRLEYKTRTQGTIKLVNVNAAMLGCVTPEGLINCIPESAFGGGFMSRFLFVMEKTTDRIIPIPPPRDQLAQEALLATLRKLKKIKTKFTFSEEGLAWYIEWYKKLKEESAAIDDPKMCGYYDRKHVHLLRLTMVLTMGAGEDTVFTPQKFKEALVIFDTLEVPMPDAFLSPNESALGRNATRILGQLEKAEKTGINRSVLLRKNYRQLGDAHALDKCMAVLVQANLVNSVKTAGKTYYFIRKDS